MRNRTGHYKLFLAFCQHYHLQDLPAEVDTLILFLEFLLRSFRTHKAATNALASIKHLHNALGLSTSAFDEFRLKLTLRALPLTVRHVPRPAPPCTLPVLLTLTRTLDHLGPRGFIFKTLCLVAFYSLARLSSLLPPTHPFDHTRYPTMEDVAPGEGGMILRIKFAKTVQDAKDSYSVPILLAQDPRVCPVRALRCLRALFHAAPSSAPLFRWPVSESPRALAVAPALTAPTARRWLSFALGEAGLQPGAFTFHSFRRGGCTLAAERGASLHELQSLGHWRSDAVLSYFPAMPAQLRAARHFTGSTVQAGSPDRLPIPLI